MFFLKKVLKFFTNWLKNTCARQSLFFNKVSDCGQFFRTALLQKTLDNSLRNPQKILIWSHLLRKSLMENFIFCAMTHVNCCFHSFLIFSLLKHTTSFSKYVWPFFKIMPERVNRNQGTKKYQNGVSCRWCIFAGGHDGFPNCAYFRGPWLLNVLSIYTTQLAFTCPKLTMKTPKQCIKSTQN